MENLTTQLGELFAAVQKSDLRQVRRLLSAHVSPNQCNGEGKTALMIASSIGHPEIIRLLCAAAATHRPPARIFLDTAAGITADDPSPLSPVSAISGYPAAALAESAPKRAASYSAIIDQPRPTPLLPDYVSAIRIVSKEYTPSEKTAAKRATAIDTVKRDVINVVVKKGVAVKTKEGIGSSGGSKTGKTQALAQPNIEDLAVDALLKGDINQLPAPPEPSPQDQSPPGRYDLNGSDAPDITAHYPIHPESPYSSANKNPPNKIPSQTFLPPLLEEDAVLAEIESIIQPNQQGSEQENQPNSLREPTPISPNTPSDTAFDNSILDRLQRLDITASQPSVTNTPEPQVPEPAEQNNQPDNLSNRTPLEIAVIHNDRIRVKDLLKAGADFRPATWYDTPVLVTAAEKGHVEIVQILINAGANVNTGYERLALHVAAEHGHLNTAQLLLNSGAYIHSTEEGGRTALIAAASAGQLALVQLLVTKGANLNAVSRGETAIMVAAKNGHRAVYEFLYSLTPSHVRETMAPTLPPSAGNTVSEGSIMPEGSSQSIEAPSKNLEASNSAAAHSLVNELIEAARDGHLPRLVAAIEAGADINGLGTDSETALGKKQEVGQQTALFAAIQAGHISSVETLLDANADANCPANGPANQTEIYPLMVAACALSAIHRSDMIELLISQGARINQTDNWGRTALIHATQSEHSDAIATLVAAQADLNIRDRIGKTALMHAEASQNQPIIQYLQRAQTSQTQAITLLKAITQGDTNQVQRILSHGGNPNAVADGMSALSQAAAKGYLAIAQQLIQAGADLNYRPHATELNPLLYAAYRGHVEMVQMLITAGADTHVQAGGLNALTYAKRGQQQKRNAGKPFGAIIALLSGHGIAEQ
ncbi:MAG: ankyrin repeat domain-containing protein [Cyanobacteria bacterium P01_F01_bin.53]